METIQKRQKLHEYIDIADDEKVNALFLILESDNDNSHQYSAEDITMFYERRKRHLKGEGKSYSVEEAFEQVRKNE
ncbi:MAG: hypothetical protein ABI288_02910 [Ginsengibacter sp.]